MGRRERWERNEKLSPKDLDEYRAKLAGMSEHEVLIEYKACHNDCSRPDMRTPSPAIMQELIQAWRELRNRRKLLRRL